MFFFQRLVFRRRTEPAQTTPESPDRGHGGNVRALSRRNRAPYDSERGVRKRKEPGKGTHKETTKRSSENLGKIYVLR